MAADEEQDDERAGGPPDPAGMDEALDAMMAPPMPPERKQPPGREGPPERSRGSKPLQPRADTERTLGLEVGRLFGLNPRLLVDPETAKPPPRRQPPPGDTPAEEDTEESGTTP